MADHFGRQLRWIRHDDSHNPGPVPSTRTIVRVLVLWVFDTECTVCRIEVCSSRTAPARGATLRKVTSRSGGIGRRAWFRSMYPQGCGGSSPFFGTITFLLNDLAAWYPAWCPSPRICLREFPSKGESPMPAEALRTKSRVNILKKVKVGGAWKL